MVFLCVERCGAWSNCKGDANVLFLWKDTLFLLYNVLGSREAGRELVPLSKVIRC